jgi:hypothetical protein
VQTNHKFPKSCVTMEKTTIVTFVGSSLVLVMEEVHHKGGFPNDLKGPNSKFSSQAYPPYLDHRMVGLNQGKDEVVM